MTAILDKKRMGASEVAAEIRAMIVAGSLNSHDRLPSERALCARYGVSRGTIRDALLRLKNEAWLRFVSVQAVMFWKIWHGNITRRLYAIRAL